MIMLTNNTNRIYKSFSEVHSYHRELLGEIDELILSESDAEKIRLFINKVREAGSYIGDEDERWTCQGYLDYWATTLFSHVKDVPDTELTLFDEDTVPQLSEKDSPYVGLRSFTANDSEIYFGREKEVLKVIELLQKYNLVVVAGPSGAGKSSLVGAGVLPSLVNKNHIQCNSDVIWFSPGEKLYESKKVVTDKLDSAKNQQTILVIDQLEEIFTLNSDAKLADEFVDWMILLAMSDNAKAKIIAILSDSFLQQFFVCAEEKHRCNVQEKISDSHLSGSVLSRFSECEKRVFRLLPLDIARLRKVIIKPAKLRNLYFEPNVIESIVDDLSAEPNPLPLLQFTLTQLWKLRKGNIIKYEHYKQIGGESMLYGEGGAKDSLAICAEKLFWGLASVTGKLSGVAKQYTFKNCLLRLIKLQEDGDIALQRVREEKLLEWAEPEVVAESMQKLREINSNHGIALIDSNNQVSKKKLSNDELNIVEQKVRDPSVIKSILNMLHETGLVRRFLGCDEKDVQIEIAHEVLVRNWPTLRRWTQEKAIREELEFIREIKRATMTWQEHNKASGFLWTDIKQTKGYRRSNMAWHINQEESLFLEKSNSQAKSAQRRFLGAYSAPLLLILALWFLYENKAAGLSGILNPFDEKWILQIEYDSDHNVMNRLPENVKAALINNSPTQLKQENLDQLKPEIAAYKRFKDVSGQKSKCAKVHLTRRQLYGDESNWIWSGFTTKFKYPGTNKSTMLLVLLGKSDSKSSLDLPIEFTQYSYNESNISAANMKDGTVADIPIIRFPVNFRQQQHGYSGRMLHPILKNADREESLEIATLRLYPSTHAKNLACD